MSPRRSGLLAAAVLLAQLALVASQAPDRTGAGEANLLRGSFTRLVAPVTATVSALARVASSFGDAVRTRTRLAEENARLREEVVELRRERLRRAGLERETEALAAAVDYSREAGRELRLATIAYLDRGSWLRTLLVRTGGAPARIDQVVVAEDGVVGRVSEVAGRWARVQLLTDRAAAAAVVLESAGRQGIARGTGPRRLEIDYVPRQVEVAVGERVVTAGFDGVCPRGLAVGVVEAVEAGDEMFHRVVVRPAVDVAELSSVFLLEGDPVPPRELREASDGGR